MVCTSLAVKFSESYADDVDEENEGAINGVENDAYDGSKMDGIE